MAKAVICPVCNGRGVINDYNDYKYGSTLPPEKTCHGCGGKGWVEVSEDYGYAGAMYRKALKKHK